MWLPRWPHSSKGCDTWLNVQNGSWRHRPAWGARPPPDLCGRRKDQLAWDRLRGGGDGGWGQMQRTGPGPGASSPLPAPPCPAGCLARIRWPGVLPAVPGGGRARAAGWLAAPPGWQARGGSAKANGGLRSHGGGPFSTRLAFPLLAGSRAQAWHSPSRASRLCCQGSVWFGAASSLAPSEGLAGEPTARVLSVGARPLWLRGLVPEALCRLSIGV